jgi:peptidoglycan/LPS O-acetylase OafA/YrhL
MSAMTQAPAAKDQRQYFVALDGLRGLCAVSVLLFHVGRWFNMYWLSTNSGLAVDLFFCLSGFVLPLAYTSRFDKLNLLTFMRGRLIRLSPTIVLATLLGAGYVILRISLNEDPIPWGSLTRATILGALSLPNLNAAPAVGGPEVFPLNGPQYTLFLELFANAVWWSTRRIPQLPLALAIALVSFAILLVTGLGGDHTSNFLVGFPRVGFSFFAGVALFHLKKKLPAWSAPICRSWAAPTFWLITIAMAVIFYNPFGAPNPEQYIWVGVLSPLLVLSGSYVVLPPSMTAAGEFSGQWSYPIYALHTPLFALALAVFELVVAKPNRGVEIAFIVVVVLASSLLAMKVYDEPVRKWLTELTRPRLATT